MGTNYYLVTRVKEFAHKYFDREYELSETPFLCYQIHLNKCSYGWRPLFQKHNMFKTFKELKEFYKEQYDNLLIYDEYGRPCSWNRYEERVLDHASVTPEPAKWVYEEDKICGYPGKKYVMVEKCPAEEAELWIPFKHSEYIFTQKEAYKRYGVSDYSSDTDYTEDPDYPIDWVSGEFC